MPIASLDETDFTLIDEYFRLPGLYNPAFGTWPVPRGGDRMTTREAMTAH
jgi:hypothetical protein